MDNDALEMDKKPRKDSVSKKKKKKHKNDLSHSESIVSAVSGMKRRMSIKNNIVLDPNR